MLPSLIPIFPLPNVVLFPNVSLPLHIFEPRYQQMITDALRDDRIIGMVLPKPGWERDYEGRPPVYDVGCAGLITHVEKLPDGLYNIVLQGLQKFRVVGEDTQRSYRLAHIEVLTEFTYDTDRALIRSRRRRLESLVHPAFEGSGTESAIPETMPDEDLINTLSQYLELEPLEKLALLECQGLLARCQSLIELLEMRELCARQQWRVTGQH